MKIDKEWPNAPQIINVNRQCFDEHYTELLFADYVLEIWTYYYNDGTTETVKTRNLKH